MKRKLILSGFLTVISLFAILLLFIPAIKNNSHKPSFTASEGTKEDPNARKKHMWQMLRNPITNEIPQNIFYKENEFINKTFRMYKGSNMRPAANWTYRGPFGLGGRVRALALDIDDENIIIAGGVTGGMFKSTNGGTSWYKTTSVNQRQNATCVAQNKSAGNRNIWYYGTGEGFYNSNGSAADAPFGSGLVYCGNGIYKSTDGGNSWTVLSSTVSNNITNNDDFDYVQNIITFGQNGVLAATSKGILRSSDGGDSWQKVIPISGVAGNSELAITSTGVIYAAVGGTGMPGKMYTSTNALNWTDITPSYFNTEVIKTVITVNPSNENEIYFLTSLTDSRLRLNKYNTSTGWTESSSKLLSGGESYTTYDGAMQVFKIKPDNPNVFYLGTIDLLRTTDGGTTWEHIANSGRGYCDQQNIVFYNSNPNKMLISCDGGVYLTNNNMQAANVDSYGNNGIDWISLNNGLNSSQFYTAAIDHTTSGSNLIIGGLQDRGEYFTRSGNQADAWERLIMGDGGYAAVADGGSLLYYSTAAMNYISRINFINGTADFTIITPVGSAMGIWMAPFILDPFDTRIMYLASNFNDLWRNSDLTGIPYEFNPDGTSVNWSKLTGHGMTIGAITAFGMSKGSPRRLYIGGREGELYKIDNPQTGDQQAVALNRSSLPNGYVHCIAVDPNDANKLIVVYPNYGIISIYYSEDGGNNWSPVAGNLEENPDGSGSGPSVRWVSILYVQNQPVYIAATSTGLFTTTNLNGVNTVWVQEGANTIGNMVVDMVDVRQSDGFVVAATMGNGMFSTNITSLPVRVNDAKKVPSAYVLKQNYPNPFNPSTQIEFRVAEAGHYSLKVYDILGKEVASLIDKQLNEGYHKVKFNAGRLSSGTYVYKLAGKNVNISQKMVLLK